IACFAGCSLWFNFYADQTRIVRYNNHCHTATATSAISSEFDVCSTGQIDNFDKTSSQLVSCCRVVSLRRTARCHCRNSRSPPLVRRAIPSLESQALRGFFSAPADRPMLRNPCRRFYRPPAAQPARAKSLLRGKPARTMHLVSRAIVYPWTRTTRRHPSCRGVGRSGTNCRSTQVVGCLDSASMTSRLGARLNLTPETLLNEYFFLYKRALPYL